MRSWTPKHSLPTFDCIFRISTKMLWNLDEWEHFIKHVLDDKNDKKHTHTTHWFNWVGRLGCGFFCDDQKNVPIALALVRHNRFLVLEKNWNIKLQRIASWRYSNRSNKKLNTQFNKYIDFFFGASYFPLRFVVGYCHKYKKHIRPPSRRLPRKCIQIALNTEVASKQFAKNTHTGWYRKLKRQKMLMW